MRTSSCLLTSMLSSSVHRGGRPHFLPALRISAVEMIGLWRAGLLQSCRRCPTRRLPAHLRAWRRGISQAAPQFWCSRPQRRWVSAATLPDRALPADSRCTSEAAFEKALLGGCVRSPAPAEHGAFREAVLLQSISADQVPGDNGNYPAMLTTSTTEAGQITNVSEASETAAGPPGAFTPLAVAQQAGASPTISASPLPKPAPNTHLSAAAAFESVLYNSLFSGGDAPVRRGTFTAEVHSQPPSPTSSDVATVSVEAHKETSAGEPIDAQHVVVTRTYPPRHQQQERSQSSTKGILSTGSFENTTSTPTAAEAAFERALYSDVKTFPRRAGGEEEQQANGALSSSKMSALSFSTLTCADPLRCVSPQQQADAHERTSPSVSVQAVGGACVAEDSAVTAATATHGEDLTETVAEVSFEREEGRRSGVESVGDKTGSLELSKKMDDEEAKNLEEPLPPPTVSMRCDFALEHRENPQDAYTLADALFGVSDCHSSIITYIEPDVRVKTCMPLFDQVIKRALFLETGWLEDLQRAEEAGVSVPAADTATAMPPASPPFSHLELVGRSKVIRTLVFRLLRVPQFWWDGVEEVVLLAAQEAARRRSAAHRLVGETEKHNAEGVDSIDVSLAAGERLDESLDTRNKEDRVHQRRNEFTELWNSPTSISVEVGAAMKRIFGTDPQRTHFFSAALSRELIALANSVQGNGPDGAASPFDGPVAPWNAFVLMRRDDATDVCAPHVRPFSFGEGCPTITLNDLRPLQYCSSAASWAWMELVDSQPTSGDSMCLPAADLRNSSAACTVASPPPLGHQIAQHVKGENDASIHENTAGTPERAAKDHVPGEGSAMASLASASGVPWDSMTEDEQNVFLFGVEGARLSARLQSCSGAFAVYGEYGVNFEQSAFDGRENAEEVSDRPLENRDEQEEETEEKRLVPSLFRRLQDEEAAVLRTYNVDRLVLDFLNVENTHTSSARLKDVTSTPTDTAAKAVLRNGSVGAAHAKSRHDLRKGGTTPFARHLQNGEDVQLAALWQRFVKAPIGDLIENLLYVRRHAPVLVREAIMDSAVQKAFWLLFFARDEVRAVTHPRRTFETTWKLHEELVELFAEPQRVDRCVEQGELRPEDDSTWNRILPFDKLSLYSQVSYACFGCAHVPRSAVSCATTKEDTSVLDDHNSLKGVGNTTTKPTSTPSRSARELFSALATTGKSGGDDTDAFSVGKSPELSGSGLDDSTVRSTAFEKLSSLQRLAIEFCFPRSVAEQQETRRSMTHDPLLPMSSGNCDAVVVESEPSGLAKRPGAVMPSPSPENDQEGTAERFSDACAPTSPNIGTDTSRAVPLVQVCTAVEMGIYRSLYELQAAGVSVPPSSFSLATEDQVMALFTDVQQRVVHEAASSVAAAMRQNGEGGEQKRGAAAVARSLIRGDEMISKQSAAVKSMTSCGRTEVTGGRMNATPLKRGRKPKICPPYTPASQSYPSSALPCAAATPTASDVPLKRKRGRPRRGTTTPAPTGISSQDTSSATPRVIGDEIARTQSVEVRRCRRRCAPRTPQEEHAAKEATEAAVALVWEELRAGGP